jgi:putative endopeptidase
MKRILIGLMVTLSLALVCAGCGQSTQEDSAHGPATAKSGIFAENMDPTSRPQDNFFMHVNGTWMKNSKIPADRTSDGAFYELREKSRSDVKAIINELSLRTDLPQGSDEQKVADLYNSIIDTARINALGLEPLREQLNSIDNISDKSGMSRWLGQSQITGGGGPFHLFVGIDDMDATRYIPIIWQGGLGLPERDYYFNQDQSFKDIRIAYVQHIEKMFRLAGWANPARTARIIMGLETEIAELHWTNVENRDSEKTYNLAQITDLTRSNSAFDWSAFWDEVGVGQKYDVNICQPTFLDGLARLFGEKSLDTWKIYMKWNLLNSHAAYLSSDFDEQNFDFYNRTLSGQQQQRPRWKRGVDGVNGVLGEVVGKVYVRRHFTPEAKVRMMTLVENLRAAYGASIDELDWMSDETKIEARRKLAAFTPKIGYPDRWKNYKGLEIRGDDLIGNIRRTQLFNHQDSLAKLDEPIRKWEWGMTPQTVNAYYSPSRNEVVFPAAILQPPFFSLEADDAVNYGGIGAVIGHEMGHGFDDQGSHYDGDGNMRNWWTEADLQEFAKRTQGLVDQYNGFEVLEGLHINGELTLGENIGDLSGLTISHRAYHMSLTDNPAPVIDGYTGEQRFFLGYGQVWRGKYTEEELRNRVATDVHSPAEYRALGSLANFTPFYDAFDVKETDAMYLAPEKRVTIW